jgi:hypothetical protein
MCLKNANWMYTYKYMDPQMQSCQVAIESEEGKKQPRVLGVCFIMGGSTLLLSKLS